MRSCVIVIIVALGLCGLYFIEVLYEEVEENSYYIAMNESSKGKHGEANMDWMYRDSSQIVDKEEYLLGRKVDKQFEKNMLPTDKDHECLPSSIFSSSVESQVDVARKLQEDPLYLIKKKEIESREQLLKNPRKMKQLQEMVARQQAASEKLKRKEIKMKKKMQLDSLLVKKCKLLFGSVDIKKLKALSSVSESSSNDDKKESNKDKKSLDELVAAKYKKLLGNIDAKHLEEMDSSSDSDQGRRADGQRRHSRSTSFDSTKNKNKKFKDRKINHSNRHANNDRKLPESKHRKNRETRDKSSSEDENMQGKEKIGFKDKRYASQIYSDERYKPHSKYKSHSPNSKSKTAGRRKSSSESSDSSSNDSCAYKQKYLKKREGKNNQDSVEGKCPPDNDNRSKEEVKKEGKKKKERKMCRSSSNTGSSSEDSASSKKGHKRKQYGLVLPANYVPKEKLKEDNKPKAKEDTNNKPLKKEPKRKLTEKEKELRLKEMMRNAKWREDLRDKNIKSHSEKLKSEKDDYIYNEDFMRKQMALAVSQGTVESRVKANINSIQRSGSSMNEHFARRH